MNQIRLDRMKSYIEQKNVVTIKELQALFPDVSLMTIHRDLDALMEAGVVVKFRGGAKSVRHSGDPEFNVRIGENNVGKLAIAQKAMELLQPHSSVFLDASTTNLMLARSLPDINLNIFTTGPSIALELCKLHNPVVTLCCGTINRKNLALSGQNTLEMLDKINNRIQESIQIHINIQIQLQICLNNFLDINRIHIHKIINIQNNQNHIQINMMDIMDIPTKIISIINNIEV